MTIKQHDIITAFICLIAGFLLYLLAMPDKIVVVAEPIDSVMVKRDTIYTYAEPDTIIKHGSIAYRYLHDTSYVNKYDTIHTLPFISCTHDTTIIGDTLNVCYEFPENNFTIMRYPQPQVKEIEIQYIYKTTVNDLRTPWYETTAYAVGSFFLGFGAGRIK